ncbi:MAG: hypothetical protein EWV83_04415 [Microcystis sp. M_OC_Ca_00000000_S217Cul]|uniref:hypothetical protein n=1 Tax=Microcystis sp. M_OC_Ca_00000000_S217Cul TaxID=2486214 RepID=UPI001194B0B2|nr:hypothetical protein [Microcystis sp. M_OC_Ca_00000000_S217Cul]TRT79373.1 MAG: hypothetical protein EWV83_04415 [Microcystis sp. M_OC_Ca_00000000_S217Cul]
MKLVVKFMGNFGQIPPAFYSPPDFVKYRFFIDCYRVLSPENGFLKETRFLSAIAGGRSGLGYL